MDNLIAEKKAKPMIIVMDRGNADLVHKIKSTDPSLNVAPFGDFVSGFETVLTTELIPFIDKKFRTLPDREHRALAGLSMGGFQTFCIVPKHMDLFAYMGGFSGSGGILPFDADTSFNGVYSDADEFNKKIHVLFLGLGTHEGEPFERSILPFRDALVKQGINVVFYHSQGTAHEWLTWRRSFAQFAPLLFRD
jgi:enterochelin esterase family protein